MINVRSCSIKFDDLTGSFRFFVCFSLYIFNIIGNTAFDFYQPVRVNGTARLIADLESVVCGRVMTGGDVHRAGGFLVHHGIRDNRCRGGFLC